MSEQQNSGGESSKGEGRGRKAGLRLQAADIQSPLVVRVIERREDAVLVENERGDRVTIHLSVFADNHLRPVDEELLLPESVYRHYFGRRSLELAAVREAEDRALLRRHFPLLLSVQDRIIESPCLSACYSPDRRIGGIPVGAGDYLSLGVLERLWANGRLLYPRELQPSERGCPSLRMVIEKLAAASR